jgi:hypothetical protein
MDFEIVGDAVAVFEVAPERVKLGVAVCVLLCKAVAVVVFVTKDVAVLRTVLVVVLLVRALTVYAGEAELVFDIAPVLLEVIVEVVVFVEVGLGDERAVGIGDLERVVVRVLVFDIVEVRVGTTPKSARFRAAGNISLYLYESFS